MNALPRRLRSLGEHLVAIGCGILAALGLCGLLAALAASSPEEIEPAFTGTGYHR